MYERIYYEYCSIQSTVRFRSGIHLQEARRSQSRSTSGTSGRLEGRFLKIQLFWGKWWKDCTDWAWRTVSIPPFTVSDDSQPSGLFHREIMTQYSAASPHSSSDTLLQLLPARIIKVSTQAPIHTGETSLGCTNRSPEKEAESLHAALYCSSFSPLLSAIQVFVRKDVSIGSLWERTQKTPFAYNNVMWHMRDASLFLVYLVLKCKCKLPLGNHDTLTSMLAKLKCHAGTWLMVFTSCIDETLADSSRTAEEWL